MDLEKDPPARVSGLIQWSIITRYIYEGSRKIPIHGLQALAKTEADLLFMLSIMRIRYQEYEYVIQ
jgi:hypothetical protein